MNGKKPSWIALIFFCTATTMIAALAFAVILTSITVLSSATESADASSETSVTAQTFNGVVTDARCGAKHQFSDRSPAACTRICVKEGSQYLLVDGDKTYSLQGDVVRLNRTAGERVTVTGALHDKTIDFTSITTGQ